jgi:hypothetical protein
LGEAPSTGLISLVANYDTLKIINLTKSEAAGGIRLKTLNIENMYNAGLISNLIYENDKYYITYGSNSRKEVAADLTLEDILSAYAQIPSIGD